MWTLLMMLSCPGNIVVEVKIPHLEKHEYAMASAESLANLFDLANCKASSVEAVKEKETVNELSK